MLSHERVWAAIDALASRHGMTASGLARKAGLDATSFNKSKRTSPEGRDRWPSTESISKILRATGASLEDFMRLIEPASSLHGSSLPLVRSDRAAREELFGEDGRPNSGPHWEDMSFPDFAGEAAFAIEIVGRELEPHFREGELVIVSPTANMRKGDRVIVRTRKGEILVKELKRRSTKTIELSSIGAEQDELVLPVEDVAWIGRVMWTRQ